MRTFVVPVLLLLVASHRVLAAGKTTWKEERSGYQFELDSKTGETQVGFYLFLGYDPVPACVSPEATWSIYGSQSGSEVLLATRKDPPFQSCCGCASSTSTPRS